MASITRRGDKYRAQVRRRGVSQSQTFRTRAEAARWASEMERDIEDRRVGKPARKTWRDAVTLYRVQVSSAKISAVNEGKRLTALLQVPFVDRPLAEITSEDWVTYRASRRVMASTINRDFRLIRHIYRQICSEWGWLPWNPMARIKELREAPHRKEIWSEDAQRAMLAGLGGANAGSVRGRVGLAFLFALETGMRAGEICSLRPADIRGPVARVATSKNGDSRDVPLSLRAQELLAQLGDELFGLTAPRLDAVFRKYRPGALRHLTFHDTRHTAATRLGSSGKLTALELCAIMGWRDPRFAMVYFNPSAADLAAKLAA